MHDSAPLGPGADLLSMPCGRREQPKSWSFGTKREARALLRTRGRPMVLRCQPTMDLPGWSDPTCRANSKSGCLQENGFDWSAVRNDERQAESGGAVWSCTVTSSWDLALGHPPARASECATQQAATIGTSYAAQFDTSRPPSRNYPTASLHGHPRS